MMKRQLEIDVCEHERRPFIITFLTAPLCGGTKNVVLLLSTWETPLGHFRKMESTSTRETSIQQIEVVLSFFWQNHVSFGFFAI